MISRVALVVVALVVGLLAASLMPGLSTSLRKMISQSPPAAPESKAAAEDKAAVVKLTAQQVAAAAIETAVAEKGTITRSIIVPGTIVPHADRILRVSVKLSGTVGELKKKIGDSVAKGEVVAVLESREVADAKSEFLGARLSNELLQELYEREKILWEKKVSGEQQYLRARNAAAQARMKFDIARQKLFALGLDATEIAALPSQPEGRLHLQEIRSPMAGRVVERKVDLGTAVGRDSLETELFVVVDLDIIWIDLAMSPAELPAIKEGMPVSISARDIREKTAGSIVFVGPLLDKDTRSARVVAEAQNGSGVWRPGSFVTASIAVDEWSVAVAVPANAVLTIDNEKVVFVRTAEGFVKRPVVLGHAGNRRVEVTSGLQAGETVAAINAFVLKSELAKATAED
jgi:membrane fusion protein, heavy metal efflux system